MELRKTLTTLLKKKFTLYYEYQTYGFNFRMNEISAGLGISQLKKINFL